MDHALPISYTAQMTCSFGFLHYVTVKCSDISDQPTSILKLRGLVQADGEAIQRKKCISYIKAGLILCQCYIPEKQYANQTQKFHLKWCTS